MRLTAVWIVASYAVLIAAFGWLGAGATAVHLLTLLLCSWGKR